MRHGLPPFAFSTLKMWRRHANARGELTAKNSLPTERTKDAVPWEREKRQRRKYQQSGRKTLLGWQKHQRLARKKQNENSVSISKAWRHQQHQRTRMRTRVCQHQRA